ncbi:Membrane protein insertase YidC [Corynebacterium afermentans subsp. afermentans]|uniref:Membrane protein insertase YidC n=1 Tax=Corynebacterium afermentans TaxID=38286 RepID=A0A9X8R4W6_9CORY|nr:membrane protein insertase YidC [Corynebacterium afermentans]OAA17475.1 membrane protein insertase YidC [Corynebacterium afermentans subsp. afermentans]WJY57798.1 Membrane protein insertase YidC [Corynebacterium afermentans subsp. afermentans]SIQ39337.1 YidC/Oxa1 family membrane protein insertase [Corynebacterium afermentans]
MLNFIYSPISWVLRFWHEVLGFVISKDSGISWILAIVLLTCTVRLLLLKPMVNQMRSMRKMQEMQPRMQEIREKYAGDQQKIAEETQKLYRENGTNPLSSCIVPIVQLPIFIGLLHVLRSFNRTSELGMSVEENRSTANYAFPAEDVQSFLDADFFGVPLSAYMSMPQEAYAAFSNVDLTRAQIIAVCLPLVVLCAAFTHLNARIMVKRQEARKAAGKGPKPQGEMAEMMQSQMGLMNKMMMWFFPVMILATGVIWHIGLLFYMLTNNVWTFFQSMWLNNKMDKEEAAEEARKVELKRTTAPAPGARTKDRRTKKQRKQGK